jgi:hypothetical protein
MIIPHREKFLHSFVQPPELIFLLARRTVAVAATVVCLAHITAMVAFFVMAPKARCAARRQKVYKAPLLFRYPVLADVVSTVFPQ